MRWLRVHATIAPFGVFAVTVVLAYLSGHWNGWESLDKTAGLVDLGAVVYAMIAVSVERGVRMIFWALDQRRQWREKWRAEAQAELLAAIRADARASDDPEFEERVERIAREKGIALEDLPRLKASRRGVAMIWRALDERRKWREKWRQEVMTEGRAEVLADGIPKTKQDLERWAQGKGILLDKLPPR